MKRKLGGFKIPFVAFSVFYSVFLAVFILLWSGYGFEIIYPVFMGLATICFFCVLTFLIIYYKKVKRNFKEISNIIQNGEISDLQEILFEEQKSQLISTQKKNLAFMVLFETIPIKTMNQLCVKIEEEFTNGIYSSIYINYLKKYKSAEDKKLMYEYLFDAILKLQRVYFTEYVKHVSDSRYSSTYYSRKGAKTMITLSYIFGFDTVDLFVRANVVRAFKIFFKDFKIGEPVNLERIAKLSRTSESFAEQVLLEILELHPDFGIYKEFEMQFIPSKEIVNFETIVDFDSFIHPLE